MNCLKNNFLFFVSFYFLLGSSVYANSVNFSQLNEVITRNNSQKKYEESITYLSHIINSPKSTNYDKYVAYLLKYVTYKALFNYTEAENNLNSAEKYGLQSDQSQEVETRIAIERVFLKFDLLELNEAKLILSKIKESNLKYVDDETQGFYYSVLGSFNLFDKNYEKAEYYYDKGIKILETGAPEHLANLYRAKMRLYTEMRDHDKVIKAFNEGISYATTYKMDIYILNLYEQLTSYYAEIEDYKNAYKNRIVVNNLTSKYDALNQSSKLLMLEKNLLQEQNQLKLKNEQNIKIFLIILAIILIVLLIVLYQLFKVNKYKRNFVELENSEMRSELSQLNLIMNHKGENAIDINNYNLSDRQKQIIRLVEQGKTNKEIGAILYISENTVK